MKEGGKSTSFGHVLTNHVIIFFSILLINVLILLSYINGFLFSKAGILNKSESLDVFSKKVFGNEYVEYLKTNKNVYSIINPPYDKIVILLIDSLRFDFTLYDPNYDKEWESNMMLKNGGGKKVGNGNSSINTLIEQNKIKLYLNNMINLHNILKKKKKNTRLFRFEADPPTITTARLKSILVGNISNYMDINENFNPSDNIQDNFIDQLYINKKYVTAIGDDTITKLTKKITKKLVYESFNIFDFYSLDIKSKDHFYREYSQNDWGLLYLHLLAVDHIGHIEGPNSETMKKSLINFDLFIKDIINKINESQKNNKNILFIAFGDHGQLDSGDHGGISICETNSSLFAYSPLSLINVDKNINSRNFVLFDYGNDSDIKRKSKNRPSDDLFNYHDFITKYKNSEDDKNDVIGYRKYHSSLNSLNRERKYFYNVKYTKQVNLISTLSFLIGSTLPFCNIGNIILDLIPNAYEIDSDTNVPYQKEKKLNTEKKNVHPNKDIKENIKKNVENSNKQFEHPSQSKEMNKFSHAYYDLLNLHYISELSYANMWQINRYLNEYEKMYGVIKNDDYYLIKNVWKKIENEKSSFFIPHKEFIDNQEILTKEKEKYIEYINKIREAMDLSQRYFYYIFTLKNHSFLFLCLFINLYFFIIFSIYYFFSKLNYYNKSIGSKRFVLSIILAFAILFLLNLYKQKLYIMVLSFLFLLFVGYIFFFKKSRDQNIFSIFIHTKMLIMFNILISNKLNEVAIIQENENLDPISAKPDAPFFETKPQNNIQKQANSNKFEDYSNSNIKLIHRFIIFSKNLINEMINTSYFFLQKIKFIQILRSNFFFVFSVIWSFCETSFNYVEKERHYIHILIIFYVFFSSIFQNDRISTYFFRSIPLLAILLVNLMASFRSEYFKHDKEKMFINRSALNIILPTIFYILSMLLLRRRSNKMLKKKIKFITIIIWTLQYFFVIIYLTKINKTAEFWTPLIMYMLTFSFISFIILRKSDILEKTQNKNIGNFIKKMNELCVTFFIILCSLLQFSLIIYSNTNLSIILFFYTTLIFFYFYFINTVDLKQKEDINNIKISWIRENTNADRQYSKHINTKIKEKIYLNLQKEKHIILNKSSIIDKTDIIQIQIAKLIPSISFFLINETSSYLLSSLILKYSFFLTGHTFMLNSLPLTSGYIGFGRYYWPFSQIYIFLHVFFPMIFSFLFLIYIFNLRKIKALEFFEETDFYNFYLYPLINFLFKNIFLFCVKCYVSMWTSFFLGMHIMINDYFLPNYFYLASIVIVYITLSILILSIIRRIFLR
ncbi:GPI ethanolamine phosphate transferase 3, putative [Plasmodium berghei]|uniref:GPI ethanolamine phosphate transferase 3, putative n=1 Tax=Plasmodium berghei TaxID=5821 RepID=A0A0Z0AT52_PLABE|nr:GPI ethanolamine phosphate transferase 3, putative [Plasmodium berghei]SCO62667.1 GPI ethanolamine phosphate transferase 3, putative [Plasmodium berghei]